MSQSKQSGIGSPLRSEEGGKALSSPPYPTHPALSAPTVTAGAMAATRSSWQRDTPSREGVLKGQKDGWEEHPYFLKDCPKREQTITDDNNLTLAKGKSMGQTEARLSLQSSQSSSPGSYESFWNVHTRKSLSACEFVLVVVSCFLVACALHLGRKVRVTLLNSFSALSS